jgi:hypothetical protein
VLTKAYGGEVMRKLRGHARYHRTDENIEKVRNLEHLDV